MRTFAGVMKDAEMFFVRAKVTFDENFEKQAVRLVALKLANTRAAAITLSKVPTTTHSLAVFVILSCHIRCRLPARRVTVKRVWDNKKLRDFMSLHGGAAPQARPQVTASPELKPNPP